MSVLKKLFLIVISISSVATLSAGELPIVWQRFFPSTTNDVRNTLTVATVSFDANIPIGGKALCGADRAVTNLAFIADIVRQVKTACAKKGGIYADSKLLVCFPEDSLPGISEVDADGNRSWRNFRAGVFGYVDQRTDEDWAGYYGKDRFPRDRVTHGLRDIAVKENVYLCLAYEAQDEDDEYRNVCTLFGPERSQVAAEHGVIGYYFKSHPVGGERLEIKRGDVFRVYPTKIGKIGMLICYDLMFPESMRAYGVAGADLVVAVTAWTRSYPKGFPNGEVCQFGDRVLTRDCLGMSSDGMDDGGRSYVDLAVRTAALQNGYFFAVSSLANPGGIGYSSVVYPSGRVMCEALGERLPGEKDDTEAKYRPAIAIANIGVPAKARFLSVNEIIGFDPLLDRNLESYAPLTR